MKLRARGGLVLIRFRKFHDDLLITAVVVTVWLPTCDKAEAESR